MKYFLSSVRLLKIVQQHFKLSMTHVKKTYSIVKMHALWRRNQCLVTFYWRALKLCDREVTSLISLLKSFEVLWSHVTFSHISRGNFLYWKALKIVIASTGELKLRGRAIICFAIEFKALWSLCDLFHWSRALKICDRCVMFSGEELWILFW